jgi:hypothetical protein
VRTNKPRVDPTQPLEGEGTLAEEVKSIFADPDKWMQQEHPMLGGRSPQQCINDGDEQLVWNLLRSIKYIGQT